MIKKPGFLTKTHFRTVGFAGGSHCHCVTSSESTGRRTPGLARSTMACGPPLSAGLSHTGADSTAAGARKSRVATGLPSNKISAWPKSGPLGDHSVALVPRMFHLARGAVSVGLDTAPLPWRKTEWMIGAPSERQGLDSMDQGKLWSRAYDLQIVDYDEQRMGRDSSTLLKSAEITFQNGSRLRVVPGRPDTVRGRSAIR